MNWLKLALLALDLAVQFARWVEREKIANQARAEVLREAMEKIDESVAIAAGARARVRDRLEREPDSLRDDSWGPWRQD